MSDLPRSVLSDAVAEACRDRRLVAAVFTTYTFDPAFFETEVLPVFMSRQFSADPAVRLAQLERRIADEDIQISVFYDPRGLQTGNPGAKLHIRRLTVRHGTGVFHPKTILALVEQPDPDQPTGRGQRSLLCMCLSANLTRSGWWENIEVAHIEEIPEGAKTSLRNELIIHVDDLARSQDPRAPLKEARERNPAITAIHAFLRGTEQRTQRSTQGLLHPAFHAGHTSFRTFLEESAGSLLRGMHMEILTPYFDHEDGTGPLEDLIQAFNPASVRISLPLDAQGQSTCPEHLHAWVKDQETMSWGRLPKDLHQIGTSDGARRRGLHAKVYRFFERRRGGKEILCIGSVNLTTPGCRPSGRVGNWESAILVEVPTRPNTTPDWWMQPEQQTPVAFDISDGEEDTPRGEGSRLSVRYHWNTGSAEAFWDKESPSPDLRLQHGCVPVLTIPRLPPATWTPLPPESAKALGDVLVTTSLLEVVGEGDAPAFLLVQEEGMACRPSLLKDLSLADILRSWALLTEDERDAFIDDVAGRPSIPEMPMPGSTARDTSQAPESMFDRFAGFFHAFSRMESRIRDDIANERWRRVELLLFGRKFDSLGEIIGRVRTDHGQGRIDTIDAYVIALCAKQVVDGVRAMATVFERNRFRDLDRSLSLIADLRQDLTANHPDLAEFLPWYEGHFLSRAAPSAGNDA